MFSADNLFAMTAVLLCGTAFAFWAENQRWGRQASGPVWAILFGLVLSNIGVIPSSAPAFAMVSDLLVPYALIIVASHLLVLMAGTKLLKIDLAEALVASNACIMGPATAAAIAAGQGWRHLVTPGVLVGVLGYVIANFLGVAVTGMLG